MLKNGDHGKKISYLKLDIEQSEIQVLRELIDSVLDILPKICLQNQIEDWFRILGIQPEDQFWSLINPVWLFFFPIVTQIFHWAVKNRAQIY